MNQTPFKNNLILQEGELDYTGCLTGGTGWTTHQTSARHKFHFWFQSCYN